MAEVSQGQKTNNLKITVETGSKYNIVDQTEAAGRGWKVEKLTQWEQPSLRYADGRKMQISGRTSSWIRLDKENNKRKVDLYVTPSLRSKLIIGLIDLKRLHWISPQWPLDIEKWQKFFHNASGGEKDLVNNIDEDDEEEEEVTVDKVDKEDKHEEEEEEEDTDTEEQKANLRESADSLLDKLERGGLIKKAPRVNNLIQRPTHPQF